MQKLLARIGECEFCGSNERLIQMRVYGVKYFCCAECQNEMMELMIAEYSWNAMRVEKENYTEN